jgi:hypothetical protein
MLRHLMHASPLICQTLASTELGLRAHHNSSLSGDVTRDAACCSERSEVLPTNLAISNADWLSSSALASAGLNVARLAGLPDSVLRRADVFARRIEAEHDHRMLIRGGSAPSTRLSPGQLALLRQLSTVLSDSGKSWHSKGAEHVVVQLWRNVQNLS